MAGFSRGQPPNHRERVRTVSVARTRIRWAVDFGRRDSAAKCRLVRRGGTGSATLDHRGGLDSIERVVESIGELVGMPFADAPVGNVRGADRAEA